MASSRARPPVAAVVSFIDWINRGDLAGLGRLMTVDHRLLVFDEPPVVGREDNLSAWRGYFGAFPDYVVYPRAIAERDGTVAVLGHTTGSHLNLPDDVERTMTLIWTASVADGALQSWRLLDDNVENRRRFGLEALPAP